MASWPPNRSAARRCAAHSVRVGLVLLSIRKEMTEVGKMICRRSGFLGVAGAGNPDAVLWRGARAHLNITAHQAPAALIADATAETTES